ncbi:hypothetical protein IST4110_01359 [Burkholderia cenocepacia]|nr:hypothetical protein IST4110_01359 [Burkholderia cenocepacia]
MQNTIRYANANTGPTASCSTRSPSSHATIVDISPPRPICSDVDRNRSDGSLRRVARCAPPAQNSAPASTQIVPSAEFAAAAPPEFSTTMPTIPSATAAHSPFVTGRPATAAITVANSGTVATITAAEPLLTVRMPSAIVPDDSATSIVPTIAELRISSSVGHSGLRRSAKMNRPIPPSRLRSPDSSSGGNDCSAKCSPL